MSSVKEDLKRLYSGSDTVGKYILAMVLLFVVLSLLSLVSIPLLEWLVLPHRPERLVFQPWTLATYMFTHESFRHILWNMILLWSGGRIFSQMLSAKQFVKAFWLGGLFGGLLYLIVFNLHPALATANKTLLGASAAVLSVILTVTAYRPHYVVQLMLIGRVKLIYITAILLFLTLSQQFKENLGGQLAHLGGILWGLFYGWRMRTSGEPALWFDRAADTVVTFLTKKRKPSYRAKMKSYRNDSPPPRDDKAYNAQKKEKQEVIDRILDKISKSGYESLSKEEKAILFKASNKQ